MSNQLTAEQQRKIEENRRKALERRALRLAQTNSSNSQTSLSFSSTSSQVNPPKQIVNSEHAKICHQRETPNSAAAPKQFVAPLKQDSRLYGTGNHITNSAPPNEVRFNATIL